MKYLAMIQARCGSHRLPNKVLMDLCGKTVLERVIERVQKSKLIDEVMVVTSINPEDISIVKLVSGLNIRVFTGSSDDVLDRYYQAAKLLHPDYIIRITADCPVFDHELLDDAIKAMSDNSDYFGFISETFPDGLDLEIIKYSAFEKAWNEAKLASEREHVTLYIKNHPELFVIQDYKCQLGNLHNERWTLDEKVDYLFLMSVYNYFAKIGNSDFLMEDILEYLNENPEIRGINSGIIRNEGLLISLKNDHVIK